MKHCLVVDDSDVIRKVAKRVLEELNFTSTEAENGQDALEQCHKAMPDIILLDWQMPVVGAMEFLTALRREPGGDHPAVFYCTSENDPADIVRAIQTGANGYIIKPYDAHDIVKAFRASGMV